jgi:undecaprenyl-diphosphatase
MNSFDLSIIHFLNAFANRSLAFDSVLRVMSTNDLLEGGIIMVLYWGAWPQTGEKSSKVRDFFFFGLFVSAFAVLVARVLALSLPFRLRPILNPLLGFKVPYKMDPNVLIGWSSFPSDHAAVFFCLAMSLWFVSRRLGAVALVYALIGSSFPRVYLGIHYPTDILAGAALGIGIAYLVKADWIRTGVMHPILSWQEYHPASFTAFLFFLSFEIAEEFNSVRGVGLSGYHAIKPLIQALR